MKNLLRIEEAGLFLLALFCFQYTGYSLIWFWVFLLAPDIGMIGYLVNPQVGAITYNIFHHKGLAAIVTIAGIYFQLPLLLAAGIVLLAHSSMDRVLQYGLKYPDSFKHTHLGMINSKRAQKD